jgi:hypothetical protein
VKIIPADQVIIMAPVFVVFEIYFLFAPLRPCASALNRFRNKGCPPIRNAARAVFF